MDPVKPLGMGSGRRERPHRWDDPGRIPGRLQPTQITRPSGAVLREVPEAGLKGAGGKVLAASRPVSAGPTRQARLTSLHRSGYSERDYPGIPGPYHRVPYLLKDIWIKAGDSIASFQPSFLNPYIPFRFARSERKAAVHIQINSRQCSAGI